MSRGCSVPRLEEEGSIWDQRWREHMQAGNGSPLHISATHRSGRTFLSAEDAKGGGNVSNVASCVTGPGVTREEDLEKQARVADANHWWLVVTCGAPSIRTGLWIHLAV